MIRGEFKMSKQDILNRAELLLKAMEEIIKNLGMRVESAQDVDLAPGLDNLRETRSSLFTDIVNFRADEITYNNMIQLCDRYEKEMNEVSRKAAVLSSEYKKDLLKSADTSLKLIDHIKYQLIQANKVHNSDAMTHFIEKLADLSLNIAVQEAKYKNGFPDDTPLKNILARVGSTLSDGIISLILNTKEDMSHMRKHNQCARVEDILNEFETTISKLESMSLDDELNRKLSQLTVAKSTLSADYLQYTDDKLGHDAMDESVHVAVRLFTSINAEVMNHIRSQSIPSTDSTTVEPVQSNRYGSSIHASALKTIGEVGEEFHKYKSVFERLGTMMRLLEGMKDSYINGKGEENDLLNLINNVKRDLVEIKYPGQQGQGHP